MVGTYLLVHAGQVVLIHNFLRGREIGGYGAQRVLKIEYGDGNVLRIREVGEHIDVYGLGEFTEILGRFLDLGPQYR